MNNIQYKQIEVQPSQCELSPLAVKSTPEDTERLLLIDQLKAQQALTDPCYAIESNGVCQVFIGGYQIECFQRAFPGKPIPVRVGKDISFTPPEITALMLSPDRTGPESSYMSRAYIIGRLKQWYKLSDQEIANAAGINRVTVTHTRKLLDLHSTVRRYLDLGTISYSTAREMMPVNKADQLDLVKLVVKRGMNTKQLREYLGNKSGTGKSKISGTATPETPSTLNTSSAAGSGSISPYSHEKSQDILTLEEEINGNVGYPTKVELSGPNKGRLTITPFDDFGLEVISGYISKSVMKRKVKLIIEFDNLDEFEQAVEGMRPKTFDDF